MKPNCAPVCLCKPKEASSASSIKCKYIQPETRKSLKPESVYIVPNKKIDDVSMYKKSYRHFADLEVVEQIRHPDNIKINPGKLSHITTTGSTYTPFEPIHENPIHLKDHQLLGKGPMPCLTTHQVDYVPKKAEKTPAIDQDDSVVFGNLAFDGNSIYKLSYLPVGKNDYAVPCRPKNQLQMNRGKMYNKSEHRTAYIPLTIDKEISVPQEELLEQPRMKFCGETTYSKTFLPYTIQEITKSFGPEVVYIVPTKSVDGKTTYKEAYKSSQTEKSEQIIPPDKIPLSNGKISGDTTHRLAYQPITNVIPTSPIIPCQGTKVCNEPMEGMTTHRNDYVNQPFSKRDLIKSLGSSIKLAGDGKYEDKSINQLTYAPYDQSNLSAKKVTPKNGLTRSKGKIEGKTMYNTSYLPVTLSGDLIYPTTRPSDVYEKPKASMDFMTTTGSSYTHPGKFVECRNGYNNCVECPAHLVTQRNL